MVLIIRPSSTLQLQIFNLISFSASEQYFSDYVSKISSYIFWFWLLILLPYLVCKQIFHNYLSHLLSTNKVLACKGCQVELYSKTSRMIWKKINLNFIRAMKNSSFDQGFGQNLSKNSLLTTSCSVFRTCPH